jgi:anti-sigma regulatory factor (Ser/Thr protein kinase)
MSAPEPAPFTFAALDGVGFAAVRGRLRPLPDGAYRFDALGPVLELARLSTSGLLPPPSRANWLTLDDAAGLGSAIGEGRTIWTCREQHLGFLRMRAVRPEDETEENVFKLEAQRAAHAVGFPRKLAAQLVGAFEEIHGNVYDHCGTPGSGLAAYRATARRFEFVVSDGGIGVLASLRTCADYAHLADHAEALKLMLMDGVSRYGKGTSHGTGFRPLFSGLANLSGELRFRSGDQALTIDGVNPGNIPTRTAEKAPLTGFVASVACAL